ncbi:hypothetical protein P175DRAFT_0529213 [Aspergillus ochraceoroseus IBT 24754]|uniref:Uncharacterized protein n=1 Tax=Aspergillus ochraceoroseus IBT 24754 TaxID=1392256 RepID=A0A2T5MAS7_9EURO|nr:uncharacterized protein P175DRAFT_0529213 [Aspergillus ochraceoroseus IBT 24754]PTU25648.1 hypothetical protein P175DRAFT_0529213 [Aspergillus ochraceoroseus IBT 24754]
METKRQKVYTDIVRLHEEVEKRGPKRFSTSCLEELGIKVRRRSVSQQGPVRFKPCFFETAPGPTSSLSPEDAKRAGSASSASATSSSGSSPSSSLTPLPSPTTASDIDDEPNDPRVVDIAYPAIIEKFAQKHGLSLPKSKIGSPRSLQKKGATEKGKWRAEPTLELQETHEYRTLWEVSQVLEDHTHHKPHAIVELLTDARLVIDSSSPSWSEMKAILRVLRTRMSLRHFEHHWKFPVLVLSYIGLRSGRILQAHHTGRHLVVECSQIFEFDHSATARDALNSFVQYYACEPVDKAYLSRSEHEEDSWRRFGKWGVLGKRRRSENEDSSRYENKSRLRSWWYRKLRHVK